MGYRIIKDSVHEDGRTLRVVPSIEHDRIILAVENAKHVEMAGGAFLVEEVLDAIYEASPEHRPDGWKLAPEWASARVIEGIDNDGDRRALMRFYGGAGWVTDVGVWWSQEDAERGLTDVRILVAGDES